MWRFEEAQSDDFLYALSRCACKARVIKPDFTAPTWKRTFDVAKLIRMISPCRDSQP